MSNTFSARSWDQLNQLLYEDAWRDDIQRFRSPYAFRGMADKHYDLSTSLMRLGGEYQAQEYRLLRSFKKYTNFKGSQWELLALAQHHGLPTRLLDWTYSPYVAMHFATAELSERETESVIVCVNFVKANKLIPTELKRVLSRMEAETFTVEMLMKVAEDLEYFDEKFGSEEFVIFFEPPALDERIVNQFAIFAMASHAHLQMEHWMEQHPDLWRKIIIPVELGWEVRDKLDQANITERVVLPGLDGLSRYLKRYYSPRLRRAKLIITEAQSKQKAENRRRKKTP
jgi:hypothetical protein